MEVLSAIKEIEVRFSEVDSMGIVWHGSYALYFEEAREEFGRKYDLGYLKVFGEGYFVPLVNLDFSYKKPLIYGDKMSVRIEYIPTEAAKICFKYEIVSQKDNSTIATGSSTQVFLDKNYQLLWNSPDFYVEWKNNNRIVCAK
jgi:acyl-CoA thioester hydrolase